MKSRHDGGSDHPSNLVTACTDCNYGKSKRSLIVEELNQKEDPIFFLDFKRGPSESAVPCTENLPVIPPRDREELWRLVQNADDLAFERGYESGDQQVEMDLFSYDYYLAEESALEYYVETHGSN